MSLMSPEEACDRLISVHESDSPETHRDYSQRHQFLAVLSQFAEQTYVQRGDEEDASWRRRSNARNGSDKEEGNYSGPKKSRPTFRCRNGHTLTRFQTPRASYTCDVCRNSQATGVTLYGCRICNWDACVSCHAKGMAELQEQFDREEALRLKNDAQKQVVIVPPPGNIVKAMYASLELFKSDPDALKDVFIVIKCLALDAEFRTKELRTRVALALNSACLANAAACEHGCAALHNLYSPDGVTITNEEVGALVFLSKAVLSEHADKDFVMEKLVGFILELHDSSPEARRLILEANLVPLLLVGVSIEETPLKLKERDCAALLRLIDPKTIEDTEQIMQVMERCVRLHGDSNDLCEQAFGVVMKLFGGAEHDPELLVKQFERLSRARFY